MRAKIQAYRIHISVAAIHYRLGRDGYLVVHRLIVVIRATETGTRGDLGLDAHLALPR